MLKAPGLVGITRFGHAYCPLDEALSRAVLLFDIRLLILVTDLRHISQSTSHVI
jgi:imidazoleglycerol phosphate dehydratase HisB